MTVFQLSAHGIQKTSVVLVTAFAMFASVTAFHSPLLRAPVLPSRALLLRCGTVPHSKGVSLQAKGKDEDIESMYQTVNGVMTDVVSKVDGRDEPPPKIGVSSLFKQLVAAIVSFGMLVKAFVTKWWQQLATVVMAWWVQFLSATEKFRTSAMERLKLEDEATKRAREERELAAQKEEEERLRLEEQRRRNKERWDFVVGLAQFGAKKVAEGAQSTATTVADTAQKVAPAMIAVGAAAAAADLTDVAVASVAGVAVATAVVDLAVAEKRREKGLPVKGEEEGKEEGEAKDKLSQLVAERASGVTAEGAVDAAPEEKEKEGEATLEAKDEEGGEETAKVEVESKATDTSAVEGGPGEEEVTAAKNGEGKATLEAKEEEEEETVKVESKAADTSEVAAEKAAGEQEAGAELDISGAASKKLDEIAQRASDRISKESEK